MGEQQNKVMIGDKCAEIYTYESQDLVYAMNWSVSYQFLPAVVVPARLLATTLVTWLGTCRTAGTRNSG